MKKLLLFLLLIPCLSNAITPVWTCGAECGGVGHCVVASNGATVNTNLSFVRSGARSVYVNANAQILSTNITSTFVVVTRFYVYFNTLPTGNTFLSSPSIGSSRSGVAFKQSDSKLYAGTESGGVLTTGATGVTVTTGVWYMVDCRIDRTNNPWLIDVNINGASCSQRSATITAAAITQMNFGCNSGVVVTPDHYIDDAIISATSGDFPIGAGYVNHFVPASDGTHSGLTTSDFGRTLTGTDILNSTTTAYQLLDDVPLESGASVDWINMLAPVASSYVECVFGPASGISTPTTAPRMVSIVIGLHAAGTGAYNAEWLINDNGTTTSIFTASAVAGVTSVAYKFLDLADPPSAASAWTLSGNGNFNNLRVRFGPTASVDANPDVYFDCAMAEAEFEEVAAATPVRHMLPLMGTGFNNLKNKKQNNEENSNPFVYHYNADAWVQRQKAANNYINSRR